MQQSCKSLMSQTRRGARGVAALCAQERTLMRLSSNLAKLKSRLFDARRRRRYGRLRTRLERINEGLDNSSDGSTSLQPLGCASVTLAMHDDDAPRPRHYIRSPFNLYAPVSGGDGPRDLSCRRSMSGRADDKRLRNPERARADVLGH